MLWICMQTVDLKKHKTPAPCWRKRVHRANTSLPAAPLGAKVRVHGRRGATGGPWFPWEVFDESKCNHVTLQGVGLAFLDLILVEMDGDRSHASVPQPSQP
jgi:hypothetical protein